MKRSVLSVCVALIALIFVCFPGACQADSWFSVKWVADGDTIVLTDGRHVRYIGIDTPEIDHENQKAEPLGYKARSFNRKLLENRKIRLVYDREKKDKYGRTLAYVYRSDDLFVNLALLKQGLAHVLHKYPNVSKEAELLSAQREAMEKQKGIWKLVNRDERPVHAYLGNQRSKRFHRRDCPNARRISAKNRVWLKNQWAAFREGYAPAAGCIVFPPAN
jgi:micrococcal nuclease